MSPRPPENTATCGECVAPLHADQRYCLRCGARHGAPRVDPLGALGFAVDAEARLPGAAIAAGGAFASGGDGTATDSGAAAGGRRAPSRRLTAALAAVTLALGAAAGAALGPGPALSVAAAPQRLVALVVPSAAPAPATTTAEDEPSAPEHEGSSDTPSASDHTSTTDGASSASDDSSPADDSSSADDSKTKTTSTSDGDSTTTGANETTTTTKTTAATVPAHVFVISLTQLDATAYSPTSPLADLVARGTLLSNYAAAGPSAAANELALLGGQVPTADCAADLAACVLPAGETSLPDQLRTTNLTWRAYVEDPAQRCAATPSARVGVSLFTTLAARKDCASNVVDPATLDADLAKKTKTPALSLFVPNACHDGSATPCADGAPAGLDGATASLHALVAKITASAAYKADGVLLIVSDAPPPPSTDPAAPPATPAPLGALVLSPRATAARTVDAATGPVALLRSIEDLLGLDALGAAAQVTTPALDGVLAPPTATASSTFPHRSHPTNPTRRSP
ncbi:hypothetical protein [Baekduia sp.]|jgi:hypothetical protein|uniref:hypothetical protein n=1 Tax=Baekduia sp. TaxID=2600305 RepID=UPI002E086742|nr:hypothetical protein [Baekduia sp.]